MHWILVIEKGMYILGDEVSSFEREFAEYLGVKHCVGVANGTDALQLWHLEDLVLNLETK